MLEEVVNSDRFYMELALRQAEKAYYADEVPVGAVIVGAHGAVVARAYNQTLKRQSPLAHAELLAIARAAKKIGDWRLEGYTLYVTLEPCALCMQAIMASRLSRVVYAAGSPLYGFSLDKYCSFDLYKMPLVLACGVCQDEAQAYMKQFFKTKRKRENPREQGAGQISGSCKNKKRTSDPQARARRTA